jgi:hypothetical protein
MAEDNFTSFTFGSSGMRVIRPGRVDPPNDPEWYLPSTPIDGQANTIETLLTSIDDLRGLTTTLSGFLPDNLQPDQYLRVNPAGDEIVYSPLDIDNIVTDYISLSDTPADMSPGSYLRINSAGDAVEHVLTAPPDGGVGDHNEIQAASNFAGKIPDGVIMKRLAIGGVLNYKFNYLDKDYIYFAHWTDASASSSYYLRCNNNPTGSGVVSQGLNPSAYTTPNGETTLKQLIDNGNVLYHGQKSGTSGVGSLSHLKTLVNSSPNGGFYMDLPDAIFCDNTGPTYAGVFRLHWIKPNSTAGGTDWEIIYRVEHFGTTVGDFSLRFLADADGTNVTPSTDGATSDMANNNLRWFIENGRAIYNGGQSHGVKAWGVFDGTQGSGNNHTITGHTGGNVASIVRVSTGIYKVSFTNPMPHADYSVSGSSNPREYGGAYFGVEQHTYPVTTNDFHIELRAADNDATNSNRISFQVVC